MGTFGTTQLQVAVGRTLRDGHDALRQVMETLLLFRLRLERRDVHGAFKAELALQLQGKVGIGAEVV